MTDVMAVFRAPVFRSDALLFGFLLSGQTLVLLGFVVPGIVVDSLAVLLLCRVPPPEEPAHAVRASPRERWQVWGLFGLALALRWWDVADSPPGIWLDEGRSGWWAAKFLRGETWWGLPEAPEPLATYLFGLAFKWFGTSLTVSRSVMGLVGALTVPALWWALRPTFGRRVALSAAFILACLRWHILASRLGTNYALLPLGVCLVHGSLVRALRYGGAARWALTGLTTALGLYGYVPGRAIPPVVLVTIVLHRLRGPLHRLGRREAALGLATFAVVAAPIVMLFATSPVAFRHRFDGLAADFARAPIRVGREHLVQTLQMPLIRGVGYAMPSYPDRAGAPVLGVVVSALCLFGAVHLIRSGIWRDLWLPAWAVTNLAIGTVTGASEMRLTGAIPVACALGGAALGRLTRNASTWLRIVIPAVVLLVIEEAGGFLVPGLRRCDPARVQWEYRVADRLLAGRVIERAAGRPLHFSPATDRPTLRGEGFAASAGFLLRSRVRAYVPRDVRWLHRHGAVGVALFNTKEMLTLHQEILPGGVLVTGRSAGGNDACAVARVFDGAEASGLSLAGLARAVAVLESAQDALERGWAGEADRLLTAAIDRMPGVAGLRSARAAVRVTLDDVAGARADALEAVRLGQGRDVRALSILGYLEASAGRYPAAIIWWRRSLALDTAQEEVWGNIVLALRAASRHAEAAVALREGLQVFPTSLYLKSVAARIASGP